MIRKCMLLVLLGLIAFSAFSEDYYYNKELIHDKKFNKLYKQFKNYYYSDGKKVYDLRTGCNNKNVKDANAIVNLKRARSGRVNAEVYKIVDENIFLLKIGKSLLCVAGENTTTMEEKSKFSEVLAPNGTYNHTFENGKKQKLMRFKKLSPLTKDIFKTYIKSKKLYKYEKREKTVPSRTILCPKCKGKGSYMRKITKKRSGFRKCGDCKGKGNIPGEYKQKITWQRKAVE